MMNTAASRKQHYVDGQEAASYKNKMLHKLVTTTPDQEGRGGAQKAEAQSPIDDSSSPLIDDSSHALADTNEGSDDHGDETLLDRHYLIKRKEITSKEDRTRQNCEAVVPAGFNTTRPLLPRPLPQDDRGSPLPQPPSSFMLNISSCEQQQQQQQQQQQDDQERGVPDDQGRIVTPNPTDILLGRGKPYQNHRGNEIMRSLSDDNKDLYMSLPRDKRGSVATRLINRLQQTGVRFLKKDTTDNRGTSSSRRGTRSIKVWWKEATNAEAYDKLCHALRSKRYNGSSRSSSAMIIPPGRRNQATSVVAGDKSSSTASTTSGYCSTSFCAEDHTNQQFPDLNRQQQQEQHAFEPPTTPQTPGVRRDEVMEDAVVSSSPLALVGRRHHQSSAATCPPSATTLLERSSSLLSDHGVFSNLHQNPRKMTSEEGLAIKMALDIYLGGAARTTRQRDNKQKEEDGDN